MIYVKAEGPQNPSNVPRLYSVKVQIITTILLMSGAFQVNKTGTINDLKEELCKVVGAQGRRALLVWLSPLCAADFHLIGSGQVRSVRAQVVSSVRSGLACGENYVQGLFNLIYFLFSRSHAIGHVSGRNLGVRSAKACAQ